ncbi:MAG TPA: CehA/McbA family metallohydrolase [Polyangiaceae bacterium]
MGVIAGLVAFGLALAGRPHTAGRAPQRAPNALEAQRASFDLHAGAARLTVRSKDGAFTRDVDLALVVDGTTRPLALGREDLRPAGDVLRAQFPLALDDATSIDATLELHADAARDALVVDLVAPPTALPVLVGHTVALRAELSSEGQVVFVSGVGQIADRATVNGSAFLVDAEPHPMGMVSDHGALTVEALMEEVLPPGEPMRVAVTTPIHVPDADNRLADLRIAVGADSAALWRSLADLTGTATAPVHGRVTGTTERALVFGRDVNGLPRIRAHAGEGGAFTFDVPTSVVQWYAAIDPGRSSTVVNYPPGSPQDLVLDVSPGGDLHVAIVDADTGKPLTARLLVHGIDGTVDPSFGPDYRASGAGPIIDALRGDVSTPLPSGHYRVAATRGIEWSIDAKEIEVTPGHVTEVQLAPRHVVPTPGMLGCDLHVHARPSFDTPVTPEDRVLSLVAAGIDFAVPTEHNLIGDYSSAIETLDFRGEIQSVPGVEITTYSKGFGHFGLFPYPPAAPIPPFKHTTMNAIFRVVRAGDPSRYFQLNHPRLPKGIGYFANLGFDPKAPRTRIHNRIDFDGIEVFNGYDSEKPERVEAVLRDYWALLDFGWRYTATGSSDSHRIQFHWAGYPRTMVSVGGDESKVDPNAVVANIKKGHATVTDGPIIEFELGGTHPGDEIITSNDPLTGHVRVRAAPWVDVTHVDVIVGDIVQAGGGHATMVQSFEVPSRPTELGPEPGTLRDAQDRTIRFDKDIEVAVGPDNGWVMIIARGDRRMDDVLPFMPSPPLGFTNPVYVVRRPTPPPPWPVGGPLVAPPIDKKAPAAPAP